MEKERLRFCMTRFDHYYDSVNNKATVFLTYNTFIVGVLVASYSFFLEKIDCNLFVNIFYIVIIIVGLISMLFTISATKPFFSRDTPSLHYFLSISEISKDEFSQKSELLSDEEELSDLRTQVHQLSIGLAKKFKMLRWTTRLMTFHLFLIAIFIFILIFNFKL